VGTLRGFVEQQRPAAAALEKKKYFQVRDFVVVRNGYVLMHVLRLH